MMMGLSTWHVLWIFVDDAEQGCQMVYIFSNQKSKFGLIWKGFEMKKVGIFYGH
jgi:hypothetical protein